jgi:hypothetical protein
MPGTTAFVLDPADERALVAALTRDVLTDAAPEEVGLFTADEAGWLDGTHPSATARAKDQEAGFGLELLLVPLTPYVAAAATAVVKFVAKALADIAKDEARPVIVRSVHRIFRRGGEHGPATTNPEAHAPVPQGLLPRVREVAFAACTQGGLDEESARMVADVITGRLAVAG